MGMQVAIWAISRDVVMLLAVARWKDRDPHDGVRRFSRTFGGLSLHAGEATLDGGWRCRPEGWCQLAFVFCWPVFLATWTVSRRKVGCGVAVLRRFLCLFVGVFTAQLQCTIYGLDGSLIARSASVRDVWG
jgi:hypothetical protein